MRKIMIGMMVAAGLAFAGCQRDSDRAVDRDVDTDVDGRGGAGDEGYQAPDATEIDRELKEGWEDTKEETREGWEDMKDETREGWNENVDEPGDERTDER